MASPKRLARCRRMVHALIRHRALRVALLLAVAAAAIAGYARSDGDVPEQLERRLLNGVSTIVTAATAANTAPLRPTAEPSASSGRVARSTGVESGANQSVVPARSDCRTRSAPRLKTRATSRGRLATVRSETDGRAAKPRPARPPDLRLRAVLDLTGLPRRTHRNPLLDLSFAVGIVVRSGSRRRTRASRGGRRSASPVPKRGSGRLLTSSR